MTEAEAVSVFKDAIEAGDKALNLYDKAIDHVIPWDSYESTMKNLKTFEQDYSDKSAELVGNVKTLLMNAQDEYFKATQSIYEWSSTTSALLEAYLKLFDNSTEEKAESQKKIILHVLESGIEKMNISQESLGKCSKDFNELSGQLVKLDNQLDNDFAENSPYFQSQIDKVRKQAYAGAGSGILLGPFGLAIAYSIAAGVAEGKLIPELKKKLKGVQDTFNKLHQIIKTANKNIDNTKTKLQNEIKSIGELKSQTETTKVLVGIGKEVLEESANKLIKSCKDYMKKHS